MHESLLQSCEAKLDTVSLDPPWTSSQLHPAGRRVNHSPGIATVTTQGFPKRQCTCACRHTHEECSVMCLTRPDSMVRHCMAPPHARMHSHTLLATAAAVEVSALLESFLPTFIIRRLSCRGSGTTCLMSNLTMWAQRTSIYCYPAHFHKLNMHKHLIYTQIFNTTAAHGNTTSIKCIRSTNLPFHVLFSRHSLRCLLLPLGIRYFLRRPLLQKQSRT